MLSDIRLQNFRSYEDASFEFTDGVNIIVGPNGSGKTNLLEAVLMIASGSSYRARDMELIAFDQPWARLDSDLSSGTVRTVKLLKEPQAEKVFDFEGKMYRRLSLQQKLPVVIFEPEHLSLLSGSPEGRRVFIDDLLEQTVPGFSATRRAYKRTLLQRNALLKQATSTASQFFPWDVRLSALGGQIVKARSSVCHTLHEELQTIYRELSHSGVQISLTYDPRWPEDRYESELLAKLTSSLQLDKDRGFSAYGPHREDVSISYDGHPAALSASRGEIRSIVLGLKIVELQHIEEARNLTPLLLLDDVFSELDGARRRALTDHLKQYQTFITTTDADAVIEHFSSSAQLIPIGRP